MVAEIVTGLLLLLATPVTLPVLSTEARVGSEEDQVALVIFCVVPLLKVPVRVNWY